MQWKMRKRRRISYSGRAQPEYGYERLEDPSNGDIYFPQVYDSPFTLSGLQIQETEDVDRKFHPRDKSSLDDGGPFFSKKLEISFSGVTCDAEMYYLRDQWTAVHAATKGVGTLFSSATNDMLLMDPTTISSLWTSISFPSIDLANYGPKALNRLDPTRRIKGLPSVARSIAELIREGVPSLPGKAFRKLKKLENIYKSYGDEYLNATFGWRPLLNDISDLLKLYLRLDAQLSQLRRDNGKGVRRTATLDYDKITSSRQPMPVNSQIVIYPGSGFYNIGFDDDASSFGPREYWSETEERVWFAGKGSYVLPTDLATPSGSKIEEYLRLLAAVPTPSDVIDLLPWSWLLSWFATLGEQLQQALGNGVGDFTLEYCYLMRKRIVTDYYTVNDVNRYGYMTNLGKKIVIPNSRNAQCIVRRTTLERVAATPFGFGLSIGDLSTSQWAILTALGLSRLNFST